MCYSHFDGYRRYSFQVIDWGNYCQSVQWNSVYIPTRTECSINPFHCNVEQPPWLERFDVHLPDYEPNRELFVPVTFDLPATENRDNFGAIIYKTNGHHALILRWTILLAASWT